MARIIGLVVCLLVLGASPGLAGFYFLETEIRPLDAGVAPLDFRPSAGPRVLSFHQPHRMISIYGREL